MLVAKREANKYQLGGFCEHMLQIGIGGLGLHLVKTFADHVSYAFVDDKNRVTLEHDLTPMGG